MLAGAARTDITPAGSVWMDGMLRDHPSQGVHDPLHARCLVLSATGEVSEAVAVVVLDVCALSTDDNQAMRRRVAERTGLPAERVILAATHTHSGPAAKGFFNDKEVVWVEQLAEAVVAVVTEALAGRTAVAVGCGSGTETTISHYRRLLAKDGHVIMNWEPYTEDEVVGPLGVIDPEVGVLIAVRADQSGQVVGTLFNHAGHPNVMSGDNLLLSAEYPGLACRLVEEFFGFGVAIFANGAQGTMDIDGLRDRDWAGMDRVGHALAEAVKAVEPSLDYRSPLPLAVARRAYDVPARQITDDEWSWAQRILAETGGKVQALADGVGDDYLAVLYRDLRARQDHPIVIEQTCVAIGETALLTFPGELYTEIGQEVKRRSPFKQTWIIGLANGHIGYVPTRVAITEGGYAEDTRGVDAAAADLIINHSLALLAEAHAQTCCGEGDEL